MMENHKKLGVGVIGCGYWGPNLVRNFARSDGAEVVAVCDRMIERAGRLAREYSVEAATTNYRLLIQSPSIDLVVIATPTRTHFALAKAAIEAGKHVLVTKPICDDVAQAEELVELAQRQGVLLAVDHTFLFTGAVRKMRELVASGSVGEVFYIDSVRINLGLFQSDVNVMWDLAPHDISIIDYLLGGILPREVSAIAAAHAGSHVENVAYVTMRYGENLLAHVHVNWLAPAKVRRTIVGGSKRMIIYDDMQPSEKLMVYDKGVTIGQADGLFAGNGQNGNGRETELDPRAQVRYEQMVSYRTGDMFAPRVDDREALALEVDHLIECVRTGVVPISDGRAGLRIVRILAAAQRSVASHSGAVELAAPDLVLGEQAPAHDGNGAGNGFDPHGTHPVAVPVVLGDPVAGTSMPVGALPR